MREITEEKVTTVKKYETSDGKVFDDETLAELHEKYLVLNEKAKAIPFTCGAYYCKTQEDFDTIVDCHAYEYPLYSWKKSNYIPNSDYDKKGFKGPDWYFFEYEDDYDSDYPNKYWVETLSEKKSEWDEFYARYPKMG